MFFLAQNENLLSTTVWAELPFFPFFTLFSFFSIWRMGGSLFLRQLLQLAKQPDTTRKLFKDLLEGKGPSTNSGTISIIPQF